MIMTSLSLIEPRTPNLSSLRIALRRWLHHWTPVPIAQWRYCWVISGFILALRCASEASSPIVFGSPASRVNEIKNAELTSSRIEGRQLDFWFGPELFGHVQSRSEVLSLGFGDPLKPLQIVQLRFNLVIGAVEPVSFVSRPVNTERSANSVPKLFGSQFVLARKKFDTFC